MPAKALIKAVETFVNHNKVVDGVTAPFMFVGCESGGHAFIRRSVLLSKIPQYLQEIYIGFLWNTTYHPIWDINLISVMINYMFQFDKSLTTVRNYIKSKKDYEYVILHTKTALQKIQDFLFDETERQYRIYNALK